MNLYVHCKDFFLSTPADRHLLYFPSVAAIHIETDMRPDLDLQPLAVAKLFAKICEEEKIDIAIVGKQSIDDDCNQTGPFVLCF